MSPPPLLLLQTHPLKSAFTSPDRSLLINSGLDGMKCFLVFFWCSGETAAVNYLEIPQKACEHNILAGFSHKSEIINLIRFLSPLLHSFH